jgi:hypothetical protein
VQDAPVPLGAPVGHNTALACTFTNNTSIAQGSVDRLTIGGTGGSLAAPVIVAPVACAGEVNNVNDNTGLASITWNTNCIAPGDSVQVTFTSNSGFKLWFLEGFWDRLVNGLHVPGIALAVPVLSTPGLGGLVLGLTAMGLLLSRRSRARTI